MVCPSQNIDHSPVLVQTSSGKYWGGFPIFIESQCVGGIGVSGGDWKQDEEIARAAVEAVGANIGDA